ncbi:DUF5107 domain-containing protein [Niameybacter massiliensis]|uniref:DUF5107 domain-containing protein n=1 Tax=Holtiella tumoricola TaxID=3018743 RepID=A0AA42DJS3_9FIRM|nr:DUF5107 domain-containing protein [Holtiella tumoricola]MDA3730326.1 DUF5107 domain-containing protein [Holtiella tumoricola]
MNQSVKVWEEQVIIPTYEVGKPDKNPMFLEKRVYQGSSGKVYPYPVIDKIYDEKIDKTYQVVYLENDYLQVMIMPELGGRIQRALDKTNNYDFVYYNHVIKPALVGLVGPWISGGIEFNWPQHHRPNTYGPVDYHIEENKDGSKTVWVSEIDRMYGTKGMAGFTLYPDKAYIEIKGQLYNRTDENQTFLWWANPAVAVNDYTQSVFPPDVHAVMDHGKRDVSKFPIATGTYYKMDYSEGVDISRYKNIPVPTSYMAYKSDYNFVGGYDNAVGAGILHVANHHISPGKKQWTWGCGDFGKAWDRNLTDEDGPYIELMTGIYTDNQPDFTWLTPYEEKTFIQYFMPYKGIGYVKNATKDMALSTQVREGKAKVGVYTTTPMTNIHVEFVGKEQVYIDEVLSLDPSMAFVKEVYVGEEKEYELTLRVTNERGALILEYTAKEPEIEEIPEPAKPIGEPETLKNTEALYLAGKHIEQYRHATYEPDPYYLEGLKRDPKDIRINTAYGSLLLRRGLFEKSETYFRQAVKSAIRHSPNPYDGEGYYLLGLSLKYQQKYEAAYAAFYKATWNSEYQHAGYYQIAQIDALKGNYQEALEHIEMSIVRNYHSIDARHLKVALLRKLGRLEEALTFAYETETIDGLDRLVKNEIALILKEQERPYTAIKERIRTDDFQMPLILARNYMQSGMYEEAIEALQIGSYPLNDYYIGYCMYKLGDLERCLRYYEKGEKGCPDYCFPNDLMDITVLEHVQSILQNAGMAAYYLGNLWYDRKQYDAAVVGWEACISVYPTFATPYRNLSLAYYNKFQQPEQAKVMLEKAFALNQKDARVFLELDQLYKKLNVSIEERLVHFKAHLDLVEIRDDLYVEYVTLLNSVKAYEVAKRLIAKRQFHPWEGGEGKVTKQYVKAQIGCARRCMKEKAYEEAIRLLLEALSYPNNLGEGKLAGSTDNEVYFNLGLCYEEIGESEQAKANFLKATLGIDEPTSVMYYNDQPPENIFFQGLAYRALGDEKQARSRFNKLLSYGEKHLFDEVKIDYFAVSLPDFLIFDDNLNKRNEMHCNYLIGLGKLGLGDKEKAKEYFIKALEIDCAHQQIMQ